MAESESVSRDRDPSVKRPQCTVDIATQFCRDHGFYSFEGVPKQPKPYIKPKFWRDPFVK